MWSIFRLAFGLKEPKFCSGSLVELVELVEPQEMEGKPGMACGSIKMQL